MEQRGFEKLFDKIARRTMSKWSFSKFKTTHSRLYRVITQAFGEVIAKQSELEEQIQKLQAFKDYVHKRLDDAGVEKEPNGKHSECGCRIGDRLDLILPFSFFETQFPLQILQRSGSVLVEKYGGLTGRVSNGLTITASISAPPHIQEEIMNFLNEINLDTRYGE